MLPELPPTAPWHENMSQGPARLASTEPLPCRRRPYPPPAVAGSRRRKRQPAVWILHRRRPLKTARPLPLRQRTARVRRRPLPLARLPAAARVGRPAAGRLAVTRSSRLGAGSRRVGGSRLRKRPAAGSSRSRAVAGSSRSRAAAGSRSGAAGAAMRSRLPTQASSSSSLGPRTLCQAAGRLAPCEKEMRRRRFQRHRSQRSSSRVRQQAQQLGRRTIHSRRMLMRHLRGAGRGCHPLRLLRPQGSRPCRHCRQLQPQGSLRCRHLRRCQRRRQQPRVRRRSRQRRRRHQAAQPHRRPAWPPWQSALVVALAALPRSQWEALRWALAGLGLGGGRQQRRLRRQQCLAATARRRRGDGLAWRCCLPLVWSPAAATV